MNDETITRDMKIRLLAQPTPGETWAQKKRRHRVLDHVLREGGPLPMRMRTRPCSVRP